MEELQQRTTNWNEHFAFCFEGRENSHCGKILEEYGWKQDHF